MPITYLVRDGDCIASIAWEHGVRPQSVWEEPANERLRTRRANGYVLQPGDELVIPDRRARSEKVATGKTHVFRRLDVPEKLNLILLDAKERPREGVSWLIEVGRGPQQGTTAADGRMTAWIPPAAIEGKLLIANEPPIPLRLGRLRPIDTEEGVKARLANLGFFRTDGSDDAAALRAAVIRFQHEKLQTPTGLIDDAFRLALREAHGS